MAQSFVAAVGDAFVDTGKAERFNGVVKYVHPDDYKGCKDANELLQKHGEMAVMSGLPVMD